MRVQHIHGKNGKAKIRDAARIIFAVTATVFFFAVTQTPVLAQDADARQTIDHFHRSLLTVMKNAGQWDYDKRRDVLTPIIADTFDIPFMAQVAVGGHWKDLSGEEKKDFIAIFGAFTTANYAARFDGYSGERFQFLSDRAIAGDRVMVETQLIPSEGNAIDLHYVLRSTASGWRVIDIFLDGRYSELATRRSEFARTLRKEGITGLIAALQAKMAALAPRFELSPTPKG